MISITLLCTCLTSCSTLAEPDTQTDEPLLPPAQTIQFLPAQSLAPGECGLFVWTADRLKQFILFSRSQTDSALWASPDGEVTLKITQKTGLPAHGQYPQQSFMTSDDQKLKLELGNPEVITGGTRFASGILKHQTQEDWERITPIVAIATCQPFPS